MELEELQRVCEAILFAAGDPVDTGRISLAAECDPEEVRTAMRALMDNNKKSEQYPELANCLALDLIQQYNRYGFKWAEAMPQMETNDHMLGQWQYLEANYHRRLRSYKKMIKK